MMRKNPRFLALELLNRAVVPNISLSDRMESVFRENAHLNRRDRAFLFHLVQGVFRFRLRLDWMIQKNLRFSTGKVEPAVLNILRIALYQIIFMDRVPPSAAVNEAVEQAKAVGKGPAAGFVNALLRNVCRNKGQVRFPDRKKEEIRFLSVYYSFPEWLVEKWLKQLGPSETERLLDAENQIPQTVIRTNRLRINRAELLSLLEQEGIEAGPTRYSPDGILLRGFKGQVAELSLFKEGLFQVQGEAAQICSHLLCPEPGDKILDLCAGLGGKSTHLAELINQKGRVFSLDISLRRLIRSGETIRRLGINCIDPIVGDAGSCSSLMWRGRFDKIMVDGPCSGLGTLSKNPDGKWSKDESDIRRLSRLQTKILTQAASLLKEGGKMLYVTCTISREENEDVVRAFLNRNKKMVLENLKDHSPGWARDLIQEQGFYVTLPHAHSMDGFFAALFTKG